MSEAAASPWLVVVDIQHVFTDPASGWYAEGADAAVEVIGDLAPRFTGRTVFTRFVRDEAEQGAWRDYYDRWTEFRIPPDDPRWDLSMRRTPDAPVVDEPTFSKWTDRLREVVGDADLVLCGVATECCVLSTAFGAADAGRSVTVVADACAGATVAAHHAALELMHANAPLITVMTAAELVGTSLRA
ncbi:isochorismatase family protein [Nocardioides sp. AN3]